MNRKWANLSVVFTSLFGYLEWGGGYRSFLVQAEWEVIVKLVHDPISAAHPLTIIPLLGQLLLIITLFQKQVSKHLTRLGVIALCVLLSFMLVIGVLSLHWKMIVSVLPFFVSVYWALWKAKA